MSAIAGLIYFDERPIHASMLSPAMEKLNFYGIDGRHTECLESAVFGHQMMCTTPESVSAKLPLVSESWLLTADARLDNRGELFRWLSIPSAQWDSTTDFELILRSYQKWGATCPEKLLGDFAFAIWNQAERTLFCARDHIGVKPFFYYHSGSVFAFASEISALLALPDVPDIIDELEISRHLYRSDVYTTDVHYTMIQKVFRLPFNHTLLLKDGRCTLQQYWFPEHIQTLHLQDEAEYAEQLMELLQSSVECRVRSHQPIGAHLSGGVDSSSIAVIANRILQKQGRELFTYSWSTQLSETDTSVQRIQLIAEQEGLSPRFLDTFIHDAQLDTIDPAMRETRALIYEWHIQKLAQMDGVRILLSGWGGDETISFNGRGVLGDLFSKGDWWKLLLHIRDASRRKGIRAAFSLSKQLMMQLIHLYTTSSPREEPDYADPFQQFVRPEFAAQIKMGTARDERLKYVLSSFAGKPQIVLYYLGQLAARMEAWAWSGAEHGMEYAYPLTDRRLMAFAYSLPGHLYTKGGWNRYIFRMATAPLFPANMTWNHYGGLKQDFQSTGTPRLPEKNSEEAGKDLAEENRRQWENQKLNPWIDVERLNNVLKAPPPKPSRKHRLAVKYAFDCIAIYENWLTRQQKST